MKCIVVVFLLVFLCLVALPQSVNESFDFNSLEDTHWCGDKTSFIITEDKMLQLNAIAETGKKQLSIPCSVVDSAEWSFRCMTKFNPSSANYSRIWLVADNSNPAEVNNGIYIEVGGSKDNICLFALEEGVKKNIWKERKIGLISVLSI